VYISSLDKAKKMKVDMEGAYGIYKQIPLSRESGAPTFSFRVFTIEPGGHTPLHTHPFEHMNYIIEGEGSLTFQGKKHNVKKGDFALVLPGEEHQYINVSPDKPMVMICAVPKEYE
jgi:quercetin dioxygenase-like cupin family protein